MSLPYYFYYPKNPSPKGVWTPKELDKTTEQFHGSDGRFSKANFTYTIIPAVDKTWGYKIFADGKLIIDQPMIPAVEGNKGFKDKKSAEKVARVVIQKIKSGQSPPSISYEDMKKLKVI